MLLDLGCGDGYIALAAAAGFVGPTGKVYAVDVDSQAIDAVNAQIKERGLQNIHATQADATKSIPVPEKSVDACIIASVLHGFVDNGEDDRVFDLLLPIIKNGGKIAIIEFKKHKALPGPPYDERLAPADVDAVMAKHGCKKVASFSAGLLHYTRVFITPA